MSDKAQESPCEATSKPCRWVSDDQYDDAGELVQWDLFCTDCFRWRDWQKEEATNEQTTT